MTLTDASYIKVSPLAHLARRWKPHCILGTVTHSTGVVWCLFTNWLSACQTHWLRFLAVRFGKAAISYPNVGLLMSSVRTGNNTAVVVTSLNKLSKGHCKASLSRCSTMKTRKKKNIQRIFPISYTLTSQRLTKVQFVLTSHCQVTKSETKSLKVISCRSGD